METVEFKHLMRKARDAKTGGHDAWRAQSTGEKLAVAMVLNEPAWLAEMQYTIAEAIDRIGPEWLSIMPKVERVLRDEET